MYGLRLLIYNACIYCATCVTCLGKYWDGEGTDGYKGRNNFAKYACKQCQKRREQWGGATTQAKFDAQKKQAEQAA